MRRQLASVTNRRWLAEVTPRRRRRRILDPLLRTDVASVTYTYAYEEGIESWAIDSGQLSTRCKNLTIDDLANLLWGYFLFLTRVCVTAHPSID